MARRASRRAKTQVKTNPYGRPEERVITGPVGLRKAKEAGANRLEHQLSGLGDESLNVLRDMQPNLNAVNDGFNSDNEQDGIVAIDDGNPEYEDMPEDETFTHAVRDMWAHRSRGRIYKDNRTWRQRIQRINENWKPRLEEMYEAYFVWKYSQQQHGSSFDARQDEEAVVQGDQDSAVSSATTPQSSADDNGANHANDTRMDTSADGDTQPSERDDVNPAPHVIDPAPASFIIPVLDIFTLETEKVIEQKATSRSIAESLMLNGYIGNSPQTPSIAFSFRTLELFARIRARKASFSVEAFTKVLSDLYNMPYNRRYRTALSNAFDAYIALVMRIDRDVMESLGRSDPHWRVKNACPACCYKLHEEPTLKWSRLFAMDANMSLKRMANRTRQAGDVREFTESDYYLPSDEVDAFKDEVKPRRHHPIDPAGAPDVDHGDSDLEPDSLPGVSAEGDPTDGEGAPPAQLADSPRQLLQSECKDRWKAAAADEKKKMWGVFDESGIFASACRHGMILWVTDLIRSGELAKYPLATISKALNVLDPGFLVGYDIGCAFSKTIETSSLGARFAENQCRCCVNAFHGYSHSYDCQKQHHPNIIEGIGLEDLEVMERIFSASNALGGVTRYMTRYRRRLFIHLFFQQWDLDKYANLGLMLYNNYRQALQIIAEETPALKHAKEVLKIQEGDLERWQQEERSYFQTLGKEPEYDVHRVAYVELLEKYRDAEARYESASSQFMGLTPVDAANQTYSQALSVTRKKETERRYLGEKRDQYLREIIDLETRLGISTRWQVSDRDYRDALDYAATRDYHRALEKLQRLVIQRLFELHKLNLNFTGYRMRTHIAKALQTRCKAIRNAVNEYNRVAVKLSPPRPTIDWSRVSHYSFLEQFDLLRNTRQDPLALPGRWTEAEIRETMKQEQRLKRAHEELIRCNVELRRVHTAILDEHVLFDRRLKELQGHPIRGEVLKYVTHRRRINFQILAYIKKTYALDGFTGEKTRGLSVNVEPSIPSPSAEVHNMETDCIDATVTPLMQDNNVSGNVQDSSVDNVNHPDTTGDASEDDSEGEDEFQETVSAMVDFVSDLPVRR